LFDAFISIGVMASGYSRPGDTRVADCARSSATVAITRLPPAFPIDTR
jgi:hypothetical protein